MIVPNRPYPPIDSMSSIIITIQSRFSRSQTLQSLAILLRDINGAYAYLASYPITTMGSLVINPCTLKQRTNNACMNI